MYPESIDLEKPIYIVFQNTKVHRPFFMLEIINHQHMTHNCILKRYKRNNILAKDDSIDPIIHSLYIFGGGK